MHLALVPAFILHTLGKFSRVRFMHMHFSTLTPRADVFAYVCRDTCTRACIHKRGDAKRNFISSRVNQRCDEGLKRSRVDRIFRSLWTRCYYKNFYLFFLKVVFKLLVGFFLRSRSVFWTPVPTILWLVLKKSIRGSPIRCWNYFIQFRKNLYQ